MIPAAMARAIMRIKRRENVQHRSRHRQLRFLFGGFEWLTGKVRGGIGWGVERIWSGTRWSDLEEFLGNKGWDGDDGCASTSLVSGWILFCWLGC